MNIPPVQPAETPPAARVFVASVHAGPLRSGTIIRHYQVLNSRLSGGRSESNEQWFNEKIFDVALLRALTDRLFEFARNQVEDVSDVELSREDLISGLRQSVGLERFLGDQERFKPITELINRRYRISEEALSWLGARTAELHGLVETVYREHLAKQKRRAAG